MTITDWLARLAGFLRPQTRAAAAAPLTHALSIMSAGPDQPVGELSGGNQQKVTAARALARKPRLIVAITPTRGVDVASKALLLAELARVTAETGAALLLATDELDDLAICDRVIVLVRGERFTEFTEPPFDREALIAATEGMARNGTAGHGVSAGSAAASAQTSGAQPASQVTAHPTPTDRGQHDRASGLRYHGRHRPRPGRGGSRPPGAQPTHRGGLADPRGRAAAGPHPADRRRQPGQQRVPHRFQLLWHRGADRGARRHGGRREPHPAHRWDGPLPGRNLRARTDGRGVADRARRGVRFWHQAVSLPGHRCPARGGRRHRPAEWPAHRQGTAERVHRDARHDDHPGRAATGHRARQHAVQPSLRVHLPGLGQLRCRARSRSSSR